MKLEGKTRKDLAAETNISYKTLNKIMNKQKELDEETASQIALAEDYPLEFFSASIHQIPVIDLTYRHTAKSTVGELDSISAEYSLAANATKRLFSLLGLTSKVHWIDQIAPHKNNLDKDDIESLAQQTRHYLGIPEQGRVGNVTKVLERSGIPVVSLHTLSPVSGSENQHSDGVTYPEYGGDAPIIGFAPNRTTGDRERFTKAHELAHLVLHRYRKPTNYREMEREAHTFAGAFLVPRTDVVHLMTQNVMLSDLIPIKANWGISMASLISRAFDSDIINNDRKRSLYIQLSARGWKKQEPVTVNRETPTLFSAMVKKEFGNQQYQINTFKAEKELKTPFKFLDAWSNGLDEQGSEIGFQAKRFE